MKMKHDAKALISLLLALCMLLTSSFAALADDQVTVVADEENPTSVTVTVSGDVETEAWSGVKVATEPQWEENEETGEWQPGDEVATYVVIGDSGDMFSEEDWEKLANAESLDVKSGDVSVDATNENYAVGVESVADWEGHDTHVTSGNVSVSNQASEVPENNDGQVNADGVAARNYVGTEEGGESATIKVKGDVQVNVSALDESLSASGTGAYSETEEGGRASIVINGSVSSEVSVSGVSERDEEGAVRADAQGVSVVARNDGEASAEVKGSEISAVSNGSVGSATAVNAHAEGDLENGRGASATVTVKSADISAEINGQGGVRGVGAESSSGGEASVVVNGGSVLVKTSDDTEIDNEFRAYNAEGLSANSDNGTTTLQYKGESVSAEGNANDINAVNASATEGGSVRVQVEADSLSASAAGQDSQARAVNVGSSTGGQVSAQIDGADISAKVNGESGASGVFAWVSDWTEDSSSTDNGSVEITLNGNNISAVNENAEQRANELNGIRVHAENGVIELTVNEGGEITTDGYTNGANGVCAEASDNGEIRMQIEADRVLANGKGEETGVNGVSVNATSGGKATAQIDNTDVSANLVGGGGVNGIGGWANNWLDDQRSAESGSAKLTVNNSNISASAFGEDADNRVYGVNGVSISADGGAMELEMTSGSVNAAGSADGIRGVDVDASYDGSASARIDGTTITSANSGENQAAGVNVHATSGAVSGAEVIGAKITAWIEGIGFAVGSAVGVDRSWEDQVGGGAASLSFSDSEISAKSSDESQRAGDISGLVANASDGTVTATVTGGSVSATGNAGSVVGVNIASTDEGNAEVQLSGTTISASGVGQDNQVSALNAGASTGGEVNLEINDTDLIARLDGRSSLIGLNAAISDWTEDHTSQDNGTVNVTMNGGSISVKAKGDPEDPDRNAYNADGIQVHSENGNVNVTTNGTDLKVEGYADWMNGINADASEGGKTTVSFDGKIDAIRSGNGEVNGVRVESRDNSSVDMTVNGNVNASVKAGSGATTRAIATGIQAYSQNEGSELRVNVNGDITANVYDETRHDGYPDDNATGAQVGLNDGSLTMKVEGNIAANGSNGAMGIYVENGMRGEGGSAEVLVKGDVSADTKVEEGYSTGIQVFSTRSAKTTVAVTGNVSARGTGLMLENTSGTDVVVEGTLSGADVSIRLNKGKELRRTDDYWDEEKGEQVIIDQEFDYDPEQANIVAWKIEENENGEIARVLDVENDYAPDEAASKLVEASIWYIVKVREVVGAVLNATGTGTYTHTFDGEETTYDVAHESDDVTLSVDVDESEYGIDGVMYDEENEAEYTVDSVGNYIIKMLRGGAMMLGLKLHKHTPGDAAHENETAPTCTTDGGYDEVTWCTECGKELTRTYVTVPATGHTPSEATREHVVKATCSAEGSYEEVVTCTVCGVELSREKKAIEKLPHTPSEAVRENLVETTCAAEGSYDEVVTCSVCGEELSREKKTIEKLAHTPAAAVQENVIPATCAAEGSYDEVVYCAVCKAELSRTAKAVEKLAHTPGEAVKENKVAATTSSEGSYDLAVYCAVCGQELSRETKRTSRLPAPMPTLRVELVYEPVSEANGLQAADKAPMADALKTLGEALDGESAVVTIPAAKQLLEEGELERFDQLPVKERMLVLLSLLGHSDALDEASDEAKAMAEEVSARLAQLPEEEKQAALDAAFGKQTVSVDGADRDAVSIDVEIDRDGSKSYERYTFYDDGEQWLLYGVEEGAYREVEA